MKKEKEQKQKKPPTEVMSVRMTKPECDLIRDIAHEYDLTSSQIIRLVLNSNMKKYVRRVYTDPEQGAYAPMPNSSFNFSAKPVLLSSSP